MRIALLSDIHGNLVALETVLREIAQEPVDQIICLGDVGALGPQPREVIERLRQLGCPVALGNTDDWLLSPPVSSDPDPKPIYTIAAWCAEQLSPADRAYIRTFPMLLELPLDDGRTLLGYHGSPSSFNDIIAATTPIAELVRMLANHAASVMVGGHTHIQMVRRYEDAYLVNVGSIGLAGITAGGPGLPANHHVHWAEYGVLSVEHGRLSIELRRTPLDMDAVLEAGRSSGMPHLDWWVRTWE
ncbi:MAG TPA: metallophosphoesterase family protein [Chloroflexia bacterium]|nr:metallophosphoesterase family protein [Chloroflexia bacterium]